MAYPFVQGIYLDSPEAFIDTSKGSEKNFHTPGRECDTLTMDNTLKPSANLHNPSATTELVLPKARILLQSSLWQSSLGRVQPGLVLDRQPMMPNIGANLGPQNHVAMCCQCVPGASLKRRELSHAQNTHIATVKENIGNHVTHRCAPRKFFWRPELLWVRTQREQPRRSQSDSRTCPGHRAPSVCRSSSAAKTGRVKEESQ